MDVSKGLVKEMGAGPGTEEAVLGGKSEGDLKGELGAREE